INDVDVAELAKEKVVAVLRTVSEGEIVKLVVSRQSENIASTIATPLPRFIPPEQSELSKHKLRVKKRLTFDVPLNDSSSAGLGISVKGRTKRLEASDNLGDNASNPESSCGIFVKLIIHGGAAYKDGRLRVNDQLLGINGTNLTGLSNKDAMNTLGSVMQRIDPNENSIRLTILRTLLDESLNVDPGLSELSKRHSSSFNILPGTPDGAASLLLETSKKHEQPVIADKSVEYAVIIKNNRQSDAKPPLPLHSSLTNEKSSLQLVCSQNSNDPKPERQSSIADHSENRSETSAVEESDVQEDPFVRESRGRQSMSEKRRGASKIDPSNLATFQNIVHQRQTSAPSLVVKSELESPPSKGNCPVTSAEQPVVADRKTLSLESISTINNANQIVYKRDKNYQKPLLHEQIAQNITSGGPKIVDSRQAISPKLSKLRSSPQRSRQTYHENANSVDAFITKQRSSGRINSESPSSPHSVSHSRERGRKCATSSSLSTLKNLFRFGSTGKSSKKLSIPDDNHSFPLKDSTRGLIGDEAEFSKLRAKEEQRRIRLQYERLKAQQSKQRHPDFRRKSNILSNNVPIFPDYGNYYRIPPSSSDHLRNSNYIMNDLPSVSTYEDDRSAMIPMSKSQPFATSFGQPMPPPDPAPHRNSSHQSHNHPCLNVNHRQTIAVDYSPCGNRYEMDYYYQKGTGYRRTMVFPDDVPSYDFDRLQIPNATQTITNSSDPTDNEFFEPKPDYPDSVYKQFVSHAVQRSAPEVWSSAEDILDGTARRVVDPVKYAVPRIPPPDYEEYIRFATTAMTSNKSHFPRSVNLRHPKFRPTSEFITYASPGPSVSFSGYPIYDRRQFFGIQQQQQPPIHGSLHRNKDSRNVTRIHF
uniref:PDZ domain-containing protein n=1 Tax=Romanomermis culicivorax TaxID=13658 RepID=A0A915I1V4_ROMCU